MKYYTFWYIKDGKRTVWATGLTKSEAEAVFREIVETFGLTAGIEEE